MHHFIWMLFRIFKIHKCWRIMRWVNHRANIVKIYFIKAYFSAFFPKQYNIIPILARTGVNPGYPLFILPYCRTRTIFDCQIRTIFYKISVLEDSNSADYIYAFFMKAFYKFRQIFYTDFLRPIGLQLVRSDRKNYFTAVIFYIYDQAVKFRIIYKFHQGGAQFFA